MVQGHCKVYNHQGPRFQFILFLQFLYYKKEGSVDKKECSKSKKSLKEMDGYMWPLSHGKEPSINNYILLI